MYTFLLLCHAIFRAFGLSNGTTVHRHVSLYRKRETFSHFNWEKYYYLAGQRLLSIPRFSTFNFIRVKMLLWVCGFSRRALMYTNAPYDHIIRRNYVTRTPRLRFAILYWFSCESSQEIRHSLSVKFYSIYNAKNCYTQFPSVFFVF